MAKLLARYVNGNYRVTLFDDGTKIKETEEDFFRADFPDSIDLKITDRCLNNCPMCHEASTPYGAHASLFDGFLESLYSGMELAIGGGDPLSHPDLIAFLEKLKEKKIIANITVNEKSLEKDAALLERLVSSRLVYGVGISCLKYSSRAEAFAKAHSNAVLHLINGVFPVTDYPLFMNKGLKILILGYKRYGKGVDFYSKQVEENMAATAQSLKDMLSGFKVVSFDNLALEQLRVRDIVGEEIYEKTFFGEDGEGSMYVDLVKREYALSSSSLERYPLLPTLKECFDHLREKKNA